MKSIRALSFLLVVGLFCFSLTRPAPAQSITIGDTNIETAGDGGNGDLLLAQEAALGQSATIVSLSFYVTSASGSLVLGLYDATGSGGHPGKLLAVTNSFAPVNGWNTANVVTQVSLAAGNYWLAYLPSTDYLDFPKQNNSGSCVYQAQTFSKGMPATFATSTSNCTPTTWSLYATLVPSGGTVVNGVCGSSNGATLSSAPTTNLCSAGTASAVTGTGPWNWTCAGSGGGTTANCSAQLQSSGVAPTITTQPQSQSVTLGAMATFTVVATGTAPLSYQWSKNGTAISNATSSSYTTPATLSTDNGATFTVTVSNSVGSQTSNAAILTVNVPPSITTQPQNQTVTVGSMATFSVVATGTAPLSYQWSKNGTAISNATSSSYTTPATLSTDNGATFTVKVTNVAGSQTSSAATLTVNPSSGVTVTLSPRRAGVTTGVGQTFTATVTGTGNTAVTWSVDGVAGGNSTVGTISTGGVYSPPASAGTHTVTATSVASPGTSASSSVAVTDLAGVLTHRYDNARDDQNLQEYALTSSVLRTAGAFGKLFTCAISDGPVYAEPLYVANFAIAGGTHNVLFVVTQQNSVYAFDADASPCTTYWKVNLDPSGSMPTPNTGSQGDVDVIGPFGIFGTPVIDLPGKVLYAVASTLDNGTTFNYRLHALDLATGAEKPSSPVVISATAGGVTFTPAVQMQRPGLLLSGSNVYVAFGSYGDANTYFGWVMGYDKTALTQVGAFNTAPNSSESTGAAIWMAGAGLAADGSGNIYFSTANGPFNVTGLPPLAPKNNFGDTVVKLTSSLTVADFFTPSDQSNLDSNDLDLGSGGVVLLPDAAGSTAHPHLAIAADKEPNLYMVDRDSMGQYNSVTNTNLQTVQVNGGGASQSTGMFSTASYWNGNVYAVAVGDNVRLFPIANAQLATSSTAQSTETYGYPGANVVISAGGASASTAIAWVLDTNANGTGDYGAGALGPAILRAYDASSLGTALWSSGTLGTDTCGNAIKFVISTVANGKVYVAGTNQITVYGLLP